MTLKVCSYTVPLTLGVRMPNYWMHKTDLYYLHFIIRFITFCRYIHSNVNSGNPVLRCGNHYENRGILFQIILDQCISVHLE